MGENMKFKTVSNGYILGIGTGNGGTEITDEEYDEIMTAIRNKPAATETTDYRLKTDLTWEEYEIEPTPDPPDEPTAEDALNILLGGAL